MSTFMVNLRVLRAWHAYFFAFRALFGKGQGAINVKAEEGRHLRFSLKCNIVSLWGLGVDTG